MDKELLSQRSSGDLLGRLSRVEPVRYTENGNRSRSAASTLRWLRPILSRVGIQRTGVIAGLSDISGASGLGVPVVQATRPNLLFHTALGQNSGSQGKGLTRAQALVSSQMESIETYCAEPRNPDLIRGSFAFLKSQHLIADPRAFARNAGCRRARLTEPLMWTKALSVELKAEALVPAEAVYLPFLPDDYGTRSLFSRTSNGLAAGSTYLEAVVHALYELIERHYAVSWEVGQASAERLFEKEFVKIPARLEDEYEPMLFALRLNAHRGAGRGRDLPVVLCVLRNPWMSFWGYGSADRYASAATRALTEAVQAQATLCSGAREDLSMREKGSLRLGRPKGRLPAQRTLQASALRDKTRRGAFGSLLEEKNFLVDWLHKAGFGRIFIANLTRVGVEVPVVKALVPGLLAPYDVRSTSVRERTTLDLNRVRYRRVGRAR